MLRFVVVFALFLVGCAPPVRTVVDGSGYAHKKYDLKVKSLEDDLLLPEGWKLDSHYWKTTVGEPDLTPKEGDDYVVEYRFDLDGDGDFDFTTDEYAFELRFEHAEHDGVIFLRAIPLSSDQEKKRLNVVLDRYLEQVAGAGYEVVQLGEERLLVEKRYAAGLVDAKEAKVAGREALAARIEVANLDRMEIDPNARKQQVELMLVRTEFRYIFAIHGIVHDFPVLMVVGYANQPAEFEEGLPAFHDFVNRIQIGGVSGYKPVKLGLPEPVDTKEKDEPQPATGKDEAAPAADERGAETNEGAENDSETGAGAPQENPTPATKSLSRGKGAATDEPAADQPSDGKVN